MGLEAIMFFYGVRFQPMHIKAMFLSEQKFIFKRCFIPSPTGVIQTFLHSKVDITESLRQFLQIANGLGTCLISSQGIHFTIPFSQFCQMRINFILQQGGTGCCAAPADISLFQNRDRITVCTEFISD